MKHLTILFFTLIAVSSATAQGCLLEGITFTTQAQIDNFQTSYPGCSEIEGNVTISGDDISNLNGLSVLTSFGGSLSIESNSILTNLTGLDNLSAIGGSLSIFANPLLTDITSLNALISIGSGLFLGKLSWLGNPIGNLSLASLAGLEGLTSLDDLYIIGNGSLTDLTGLNNILSVNGTLFISGNYSLTSLNGLGGLSFIGGNLQIGHYASHGPISNPLLSNLTGLEGLTEIENDLIILGGNLINLEGLNNLATIGNDYIMQDNNLITSLEGLDNLASIYGSLSLGPYPGTGGEDFVPGGNPSLESLEGMENEISIGSYLVICKNESLTSLTGLEHVTSIGGDLSITSNNALTSLIGLDNVNAASIENLEIYGNSLLFECKVESICNYLASPNGTIEIHDNASGCNSQEEVEAACGVGVEEVGSWQFAVSCYPNPFSHYTTLEYELVQSATVKLTISNYLGQQVTVLADGKQAAGKYQVQWDAEEMPAGIYFLRLSAVNCQLSTKGKLVIAR